MIYKQDDGKERIMSCYFSLCKFSYYHLGQSGIETEVFREYVSQQVDDFERCNLHNFTEAFLNQ